ncbi:MAG: DUF3830 family protein [Rhodobacteraceae bacterium]|nr:DUF3830 family protein [Paracoccaceae bacterium]
MPDRSLYIAFPDDDVRAGVTLYWENAPVTCATLWDALATPFRAEVSHAIFSGPELMTGLPESHRSFDPRAIPVENQTVIPEAGELLWFYQPKNFFRIDPSEFWEIGFFYAHGGRTFGPTGWIPCNYFGKITSGLDEVATMARRVRREGVKTIEIGRA